MPERVILSQSNPVYDHRGDLPHHIRTQLQSRIRKPAQNLEPDAKRFRLDAGKRAVLMLSHDVSSGPECCKPVTIFKSCENSGCADVLRTRRAANKEVLYDALVNSQQVCVDAAMVGEWDKWNEFGVTKFLSQKQLNDIMKRNPDQKNRGNQMGLHGEDHPGQARLQGSTGRARGREMLDVRGTSTARKCSRQLVLRSSRLEQGLYYLHGPPGLEALVHTRMSTTFCLRPRKPPRNARMLCEHLVHELHLKRQSGLVVYCGRTIFRDGNHIKVTQTRSTMSLECMSH